MREWNPRRKNEELKRTVVISFSGIPLSHIFVSKVICILKSVTHDVVGILVTSKSRLSRATA